jgi:hypothetical protein
MRIRLLLALPLLAATAGCENFDPYQRAGTWRPAGANEQNLVTMAAQPAERVRGTGAQGASGAAASAAIERLRADRLKPLPDTGMARIVTVPSGAQGGN